MYRRIVLLFLLVFNTYCLPQSENRRSMLAESSGHKFFVTVTTLQICLPESLSTLWVQSYSHTQHKACTRPQILVAYIHWRLLRHSGAVYFALDMFKNLTSIDLAVDPKLLQPIWVLLGQTFHDRYKHSLERPVTWVFVTAGLNRF